MRLMPVFCHYVYYSCDSSSSLGPGAYAPDAPQPLGLLCNPYCVTLNTPPPLPVV
jgi:hypothetical protein